MPLNTDPSPDSNNVVSAPNPAMQPQSSPINGQLTPPTSSPAPSAPDFSKAVAVPAKPGQFMHNLSHAFIASLLGTMAGPPEPSSYTTDETGKMTPVMPSDGTGARIRRIASAALRGLAAGSAVPPQKSGLAAGLAGAGAGFEAQRQQMTQEDLLKRQQSKEQFEQAQQAKLQKFNIARGNAAMLTEAFANNKYLNEMDPVRANNLSIVQDIQDYKKEHPEQSDLPNVEFMSKDEATRLSNADPHWHTEHHVLPIGSNPAIQDGQETFNPDGTPKFEPHVAVIDGFHDGRVPVPKQMVDELRRYGSLGMPNFTNYDKSITPGEALMVDDTQFAGLLANLSTARRAETEGKIKPEIAWEKNNKGNLTPVLQNSFTKERIPTLGMPTEAVKEGEDITLKNAQAQEAKNKGLESLANYNMIMRQLNGPDGRTANLSPEERQALQQQAQGQINQLPKQQRILATTLQRQYPDQFDALMAVALGDAKVENFTSMLRKGVYQMTRPQAVDLIKKFINPDFSEQLYLSKQNMQNQYTSQKAGDPGAQISSFNNFLQHSGALYNIAKQYKDEANSPLLDKPIRKLEQETGDQNVIKLWTAVSAPAQEYASFLNGNKALYESERDTRDKIINGDATINQMVTFLKTAVPVAIDRLDSLDENWRSLGIGGYPNIIHPKSLDALDTLGLGNLAEGFNTGGQLRGVINRSPQNGQELPEGNGQPIDKATAQQFYKAAGNDPQKATQLATQKGWKVQ